MPVNIAWGPVANVPANVDAPTSALTIDAPDVTAEATADLAAQSAGINYRVRVEYRKAAGDAWREIAAASGTTLGGPAHDKTGAVVESGVRVSPIPDVGVGGRQLRAVAFVSAPMTNVSGHVKTS